LAVHAGVSNCSNMRMRSGEIVRKYESTLYLQVHTKVVVYLLVISPSRNPERIRLSYQYWYYLLVQHLATSLLL